MLLVLDVHKAQNTDRVHRLFETQQTTPVYVPPGCTSLVQPLDVSFNAPFKAVIGRLANEHVAANLTDYVQGTIPATERRILFTRWVGQAWEELSANKDMIKRSFKKCGISVAIDGSEDASINIEGLSDYTYEATSKDGVESEEEDSMEADIDSGEKDPFAEC